MPKLGYGYALYPGGASSLPSDISGLGLWLKADAGVSKMQGQSILANGLLAYWNLDNNSWIDSSGKGRTLISNNEVGNSSGIINNGAIFNETNWLKANSNINFGGSATICAWVKTTTDDGYRVIFASNENIENNFQVVFNPSGQIYFEGGAFGPITSSASYNDDSWHFVVLKYGSGTIELSIDNVSIGTQSYTYPNYNVGFFIGANNNGDSKYIGKIDEVGAWNRALSVSEITSLYNSGIGKTYPFEGTPFSEFVTAWADQSGNGNNASSSEATRPTFVSNALNAKPVLRFDGSGQKMALTSSIGGIAYSIFIVCKNNDNIKGSMYLWSLGLYSRYIAVITDSNYNENARNKFILAEYDAGDGQEPSVIAWSTASATNSFFIGTAMQNGGGKAYLNGSGGVDSLGTLALNNTFNSLGGYGFGFDINGDVAEIISYNRTLTNTERQQVEGYLNAKYAIY